MDPAGLLLYVAAVLDAIDRYEKLDNSASSTLISIRSHIKTLDSNLRRLHEWLHHTDTASKAQVMHSLQDALQVMNYSIHQLQNDLDSSSRTATSDTHSKSSGNGSAEYGSVLNELLLKQHLTNVRECGSLSQLTLSVCQLPAGRDADRQFVELGQSAKALLRTHAARLGEWQTVVREQGIEGGPDRSAHFHPFVKSIPDAEEDLLRDSRASDSRMRRSPQENNRQRVRAESNQLNEGGSAFTSDIDPDSKQSTQSKEVVRKPVKRLSISAASVMSDATLDVTPTTPDTAHTASTFGFQRSPSSHYQRLRATPTRSYGPSNTDFLFNQASGSLNSLADDFATIGVQGNHDSPPPYGNTPASPLAGDIKRRDTRSTSMSDAVRSDIMQVVRNNQSELLLAMLDRGIGIDEVDPETGRTAVIESANLRRTKISQILIRCGSRLHLKDLDGNTALHFASRNGDTDTCVRLLNAGAQLNEYNRNGEGPLDLAAREGHTEVVICLLNTWTSQGGHSTTLMKGFLESTKSGNASTAQAFIERGIKPNKLKESYKPMAYAVSSGSDPMVDLLLAHKCSLKDRSPRGWNALHFAAHAGHTAMVEKLLSWKLKWSSTTTKRRETALHLAVHAGHTSTALALILHKDANLSMKDVDEQQAIHHAIRNGDTQLTAALLNHGARIDANNKYGWFPIHIAAAYGHLSLVAELITRGAQIDGILVYPSTDQSGKTNEGARLGYWCEIHWPHASARPIDLALEFGHDDVVNMLIASGAKIEEVDVKGWRPLHYAAWNCRPQMVELLLSRGASPHVTTVSGNTPLSLGFRESGLIATYEDKERICGILHAAMNARKKTKMQQFSGFMSSGNKKPKDVQWRNKAWNTAELAAALYHSGQLGEGGSESDLQLTTSISSQHRSESIDQDDDDRGVQSDPPGDVKRTLD